MLCYFVSWIFAPIVEERVVRVEYMDELCQPMAVGKNSKQVLLINA